MVVIKGINPDEDMQQVVVDTPDLEWMGLQEGEAMSIGMLKQRIRDYNSKLTPKQIIAEIESYLEQTPPFIIPLEKPREEESEGILPSAQPVGVYQFNALAIEEGVTVLEQVKSFHISQPFFFDKQKLWWLWDKKEY